MRLRIGLTGLWMVILLGLARGQFQPRALESVGHSPVLCATMWLYTQPEVRAALEEFRLLASQREGLERALEAQVAYLRSLDAGRAAELEEVLRRGLPLPGAQGLPVQVGESRLFRVYNFQNRSYDQLSFTLRLSGTLVEIWVADDQWGEGKITQNVVEALLSALEQQTSSGSYNPNRGIVAIEQEVFGQPPNVDGSGKLKVLLLDIQDGWTEGSNSGYVAGFFNGVDLSLSNPNSNRADILYVDTYPGIYRQNRPADPNRPLGTVAHEYQHLIHARYGRLNTFQNEGQSEWAEILCGFTGRGITYLAKPNEVNLYLYTWRSGDLVNVLNDYERASLFHTYLADRIGPLLTGQITRGPTGRDGYQAALMGAGLDFEAVLADFHVANWVNDVSLSPRWGYQTAQRRGVRASNPSLEYSQGTSASEERRLAYGGAEYVRFFGVVDLSLELNIDAGTRAFAVLRAPGGTPQVQELSAGTRLFSGSYESIVLVVVNVRPLGTNEASPGERTYRFAATWRPLAVRSEELSYAGSAQYYAELPGDPRDPSRAGIQAYAYRFTPSLTGYVQEVRFPLNGRDSSLMGSGKLRLVLTTSRLSAGSGPTEVWVPDQGIDSVEVPFSSLQRGSNTISLSARPWNVQAGRHYHVVLRVVEGSANARLEFLLDAGSSNQSDPNYWPARTRLYVLPPSVSSPGWYWYTNNNNLLMTVRVVERLPTAAAEEVPQPDKLAITLVYPHPVGGRQAVVRYRVPDSGPVRMELYDLLGRRVGLLAEGLLPAGEHVLLWEPAGLSPGLYWLVLRQGQGRAARPVVVRPQ